MTLDDILGVELTPLQRVFIEEAKKLHFDSKAKHRYITAHESVSDVKWFYGEMKVLLETGEI